MPAYADASFLVRIYTPHVDSPKALTWMQRATEALPFTPFHRHELRNGIRLRVFREEITVEQRKAAFRELDSDLEESILAHTLIPWTDTFREAENLAAAHTERSLSFSAAARALTGPPSSILIAVDALPCDVGLALTLGATDFLTFDARQAKLAKAAGLKVKP